MTYIYDAKFSGNILIVGRTGCGKTALVQKLAINKFFRELDIAEWISYIKLDKPRSRNPILFLLRAKFLLSKK